MSRFFTSLLRAVVSMVLCSLLASVSSAGQVQDQEARDSDEIKQIQDSFRLLKEGKYLSAQVAIEAVVERNKDPELQDLAIQELATLRSFLGDYQGALTAIYQATLSRELANPSKDALVEGARLLNGLSHRNAVEAILELAKDRQIVILNETHQDPRHRAFALQLAPGLRSQGFEYFAAEAFSPFTRSLKRRGFPDRRLGHYTMEPVFGCLAREVVRLGYEPVAYEHIGIPSSVGSLTDQINEREAGQCQNLMKRIFEKDPEAKVFIHVGASHAREKAQGTAENATEWMAARLARATGLDPLTIDQTTQTEHSDQRLDSAIWQAAREKGWLDQPIVLLENDGNSSVTGGYEDAVDLQVFHPPARNTRHGRPDWLVNIPGRVPVVVPASIAAESDMILVQAFLDSESEEAVPFDQVVLKPNSSRSSLILVPGEYRLVVQDTSGNEIRRQSLNVQKGQ